MQNETRCSNKRFAVHVPFFSFWIPFDRSCDRLTSLGSTIFSGQSQWWNLSWKKTCQQLWKSRTNSSALSSPQAISTAWMLSRSLPAQLSASYLHDFPSVHHAVSLPPSEALPKLFPRFRLHSACCLAPSQRSSPQPICTVSSPSNMLYRSVPCCTAPSQRSFLQAICTVSCPSSMVSRSLPAKLSPTYFHRYLSVQHAVSLPPGEDLRKLFAPVPLRPACCLAPSREALRKLFAHFPVRPACCLAPSQRNFPQAISTVSDPSSMLSRSLPALRNLFARFRIRPACCLAPCQRSSPQAICTVPLWSRMLSRSLL